jgi:hypothetical protein
VQFQNPALSYFVESKIVVVDTIDFVKLINRHRGMKKHNVAARMKVAAVTLSNLAKSERFAKVPAPPEGQSESMMQQVALPLPVAATASPSAHGDGPILAPLEEARGDGPILAPLVEARGDGPILAPLVEARGDGQILAHLVQAAPSSSLVLPPSCFAVTCKNASMYGKKMRHIHMAGFFLESDEVIRFRSSDGKVAVADVLVAVGRYVDVKHAQVAIYKLIDANDDKVLDLDTLEVDNELFDQKVCTLFKTIQIVGTKFQIVATIWNFWY